MSTATVNTQHNRISFRSRCHLIGVPQHDRVYPILTPTDSQFSPARTKGVGQSQKLQGKADQPLQSEECSYFLIHTSPSHPCLSLTYKSSAPLSLHIHLHTDAHTHTFIDITTRTRIHGHTDSLSLTHTHTLAAMGDVLQTQTWRENLKVYCASPERGGRR